jgi:release factor glutamine methyltransferase
VPRSSTCQSARRGISRNARSTRISVSGRGTSVAGRTFNIIVSNPPYVRADDAALEALQREPQSALVAGDDGLDAIRIIARDCLALLPSDGVLLVEHGAEQQDAVANLFASHGWEDIACHTDYAGLPRVTVARRR